MAKQQILQCGPVFYAGSVVEDLKKEFDVLPLTANSRDEFFADLKGKYSDVAAIYRHGGSAGKIGEFDKELIDALPASVKFIAHHGAGYDDVDVEACTARGIKLAHTPGAVDNGTATVAMYLIIGALRQFSFAEKNARAGNFKKGTTPAHDPENKVLGIVGMGGIGRALAKRAHGFDIKVQYHNRKEVDPALLSSFPAGSIKYVSTLDELLATSDIVSLNLPLNAHTQGFFGKKQFDTMKKGSVLINTARGGVVDEPALLEALESGQLFSAGLDVFPDEPNINPALRNNDKITILPHMGTETVESRFDMESTVLKNVESGLKTGKLINQVPEQAHLK
ncbi:putative 2-hydroxyacid dehydrogenase UNK4.10 [Pseudohyphozyma bogoriensis]|nr:putative 2-hydroxyacid dehydrogenase UNK4.10 [Pseudohyphozyma bogoriensis]